MAKASRAAQDPIYKQELARIKAAVLLRCGDIDDRRHKEIYGDENVRIPKDQWSRKWHGLLRFSYPEEERLRLFFQQPPGWPRGVQPEPTPPSLPRGNGSGASD